MVAGQAALPQRWRVRGHVLQVFYGERKIWWIHVKATGPTGHGSRFVKNSAVEKLVLLGLERKPGGTFCSGPFCVAVLTG